MGDEDCRFWGDLIGVDSLGGGGDDNFRVNDDDDEAELTYEALETLEEIETTDV